MVGFKFGIHVSIFFVSDSCLDTACILVGFARKMMRMVEIWLRSFFEQKKSANEPKLSVPQNGKDCKRRGDMKSVCVRR